MKFKIFEKGYKKTAYFYLTKSNELDKLKE